ncbi:hypothetical protein [Streptomyces mayonensis]|uniref:hypothetical protein n=1 Tax=Streptomyces mayonensis TaxID=2750816 RepID=UPI001C1E42E1|nr:hypothetical protein [Streptomyces sp. A108]MBU6532169.1 hypothetical protein [Streptomyces sp. A108]
MTGDDLTAMLAEQTPACGPARHALLTGGTFAVWAGLVSADQLFRTYRARLRLTQKRGQPTLALAETVEILKATEDELLRIGRIDTADRVWTFMLFLNATASMVLACTGVATTRDKTY